MNKRKEVFMENQAVHHMYSFYHLMELRTGSIICGAQSKIKVGGGQHVQRRLSTKELMLSNCGARQLLRVPWTANRSNQSILKDINHEYSLEGLRLKVKLQYFCHLNVKSQLVGKDPDAGKD